MSVALYMKSGNPFAILIPRDVEVSDESEKGLFDKIKEKVADKELWVINAIGADMASIAKKEGIDYQKWEDKSLKPSTVRYMSHARWKTGALVQRTQLSSKVMSTVTSSTD